MRVMKNVRDPVCGVFRVQRQVGGPRFDNGENRYVRVE